MACQRVPGERSRTTTGRPGGSDPWGHRLPDRGQPCSPAAATPTY